MTDELVFIAFTILLPITPAYILYKALPARATVKGPFKGLDIQLSGAFAGYFLLVLLIFGFHYSQPRKNQFEVWKVKGQLKTPTDLSVSAFSLQPQPISLLTDGTFEVYVATKPGLDGGVEFPTLLIQPPGFEPININLNQSKPIYGEKSCHVSKSDRSKSLQLDDPVVLTRIESNTGNAYKESGSQKAVPVSETEAKQ